MKDKLWQPRKRSISLMKMSGLFLGQFALMRMAYGCPMCSDLIGRGKDALKIMQFGDGVAWSIGLFFLMPVLLIGGMVLMIYRSQRNQKLRSEKS